MSEFLDVFQDLCKSVKSEEFWIRSKSPTAMILKVLYRFLICYIVLWQYAVKLDSKHGSPNVQHCFAGFFTLSNKTINFLCNDE